MHAGAAAITMTRAWEQTERRLELADPAWFKDSEGNILALAQSLLRSTLESRTDLVDPQEHLMRKLLLTIALTGCAGLAFGYSCPNEMKAIDAKLAANVKLSDADAAKVKQLRAEGEAAHKAGKHDESMKALGEAKKLLGI
jgi:hypothetical protein